MWEYDGERWYRDGEEYDETTGTQVVEEVERPDLEHLLPELQIIPTPVPRERQPFPPVFSWPD